MTHYKELPCILEPTATESPRYSFATGGRVEAGTASLETQPESLEAEPSSMPVAQPPTIHAVNDSSER